MGYWIDEHKKDVYLLMEECEKNNNCRDCLSTDEDCPYVDVCDNIETALSDID